MNWLNPLTRLAAEALLNSLWSGILLSGAVICVLRIFRRTSAKTRFAIWWLTLLAVIGLPLLFGFSTRGGNDDTNPTVSYHLTTSEKSFHVTKIATDGDDALEAAQGKVKEIRSATETQVTPQSEHIPLTRSLGSIRLRFSIAFPSSYWLLFSFLGWFVVTAAMVCRVIRSCRHIRKLSRDASQLSQKYQDRLMHAKKIIGLKRTVRLCDSAQISQPMAIGLIHPMILIPKSLTNQLTEAELDLVLLHELAHIKRWDNWTLLLQKLAELLFFFNPTVWWIGRQLNEDREVACDDLTVGKAGESLSYAACLTKLVELIFASNILLWQLA